MKDKKNLMQNGAWAPDEWIDFVDIVKYFYFKFEADYETIEIAYDLNISTRILCFFRYNGFKLENGNTLRYEEVKKIAEKYYDEVIG